MKNAAHAEGGLNSDPGKGGKFQQGVCQLMVETVQPVVQHDGAHEASHFSFFYDIRLIMKLKVAAKQSVRHRLCSFSVLVLNQAIGKADVPLLNQALQNQPRGGKNAVFLSALEAGRRAEFQPVAGASLRGGEQLLRFL